MTCGIALPFGLEREAATHKIDCASYMLLQKPICRKSLTCGKIVASTNRSVGRPRFARPQTARHRGRFTATPYRSYHPAQGAVAPQFGATDAELKVCLTSCRTALRRTTSKSYHRTSATASA